MFSSLPQRNIPYINPYALTFHIVCLPPHRYHKGISPAQTLTRWLFTLFASLCSCYQSGTHQPRPHIVVPYQSPPGTFTSFLAFACCTKFYPSLSLSLLFVYKSENENKFVRVLYGRVIHLWETALSNSDIYGGGQKRWRVGEGSGELRVVDPKTRKRQPRDFRQVQEARRFFIIIAFSAWCLLFWSQDHFSLLLSPGLSFSLSIYMYIYIYKYFI